MRFNKRITLVKRQGNYYDPEKGENVELPPKKSVVPCNVTSLGIERKKELFGDIDVNILVVRLQRPHKNSIDYVMYNDKKHTIKSRSDYKKGVLYIEN